MSATNSVPSHISYKKMKFNNNAKKALAKLYFVIVLRISTLDNAKQHILSTAIFASGFHSLSMLLEREKDEIAKIDFMDNELKALRDYYDPYKQGADEDDDENMKESEPQPPVEYNYENLFDDMGCDKTTGRVIDGQMDSDFENGTTELLDKLSSALDPQEIDMETGNGEEGPKNGNPEQVQPEERTREQFRPSPTPATFPIKSLRSKRGISNLDDVDDNDFGRPEGSEYLGYFGNGRGRRVPCYGFGNPDFYQLIVPENAPTPDDNIKEDLRYASENGNTEIKLGDPGVQIRRILGVLGNLQPRPSARFVLYCNVAVTILGNGQAERDTLWTTYSGLIDAHQYVPADNDCGYIKKGKIGKKDGHKMFRTFTEARKRKMKILGIEDVKIPKKYLGEQPNSPSDIEFYLRLKEDNALLKRFIKSRKYGKDSESIEVEGEMPTATRAKSASPKPEDSDSELEMASGIEEYYAANPVQQSAAAVIEARITKSVESKIKAEIDKLVAEAITKAMKDAMMGLLNPEGAFCQGLIQNMKSALNQ